MAPAATAPPISGLHHVATLVPDLAASLAWYRRVLGAVRLDHLDHHDASGELTAVIVEIPNLGGVLQLRRSAEPLPAHYDPLTLEVRDLAALGEWAAHLHAIGVHHSGVIVKRTGHGLEAETPEGTILRFYTAPSGGFRAVEFQE
ncbi:VOC family protein [Agromyces subbeticus]|uniref:VOC family protein n=1 Tax=Agromyces subbeticus TaxID=293890 RepID=UPI0003B3EB51|nr:VOC family protein [Agromyces subbeticus]